MSNSDSGTVSRYYLYVGQGNLSPSNVFFEVQDASSARDLCELFETEYGVGEGITFGYKELAADALVEEVRLCEALGDLAMYDDPDPGIYDPQPSRQVLDRAEYYRRATLWYELIQDRRDKARRGAASSAIQNSQEDADMAVTKSLDVLRRLLEKHRLMFLYFATPQRVNPLNHDSWWEGLRRDQLPNIPPEKIDSEGEFLFTYRRTLETFAQTALRQFGTGPGDKPRVMDTSGKVVDVEGGSHPYWALDGIACVYLEDSADKILEACRDTLQCRADQTISSIVEQTILVLHDEGQTKWYAPNLVRWSYLMRLDEALHALKRAEFEVSFRSGNAGGRQAETSSPAGAATDAVVQEQGSGEYPNIDELPAIPEEDQRNSALLLLMLLAQAYYKMLEATVSMATWFTVLDLELNQWYLWTVQNLEHLLKNDEHLRDFPGRFEPVLPDLYPTTIGDLEWQDMIAPNVEGFLATVQKYVMTKGCCEPAEKTPAWLVVTAFRSSVQKAVECAENHSRRLRHFQKQLLEKPAVAEPAEEKVTVSVDRVQTPRFPTPKGSSWADVDIKFVDGETVTAKVGDQSGRYLYTEMGMIDGRDKKPTKQWELLRVFAQNQGVLTWSSAGASPRNQKRREVLAENLKEFFGIDGDPIVLTDDKKGWRTVFSVNS